MRSLLAIGFSVCCLGLGVGLTACLSQSQPQTGPPGMTSSDAGSGSDMECHDETPTGSTISHEVCRPKTNHDDQMNQPGVMSNMQGPAAVKGKGF